MKGSHTGFDEEALERLDAWAADATRPAVILTGDPGSGKTALLDVLAARHDPAFRIVRLADPRQDPDALASSILDALGVEAEERPRAALAGAVAQGAGAPILLLIDEGDSLSPRAEMWLFDLVRRSAARLRLVLAVSRARMASERASAFGADTEVISIDTPGRRAEPGASAFAQATPLRGSSTSAPAPARRGALLRWLIVPGALAASFGVGFVTSELLESVRATPPVEPARAPLAVGGATGPAPDVGEALPPVAAAPPAAPEERGEATPAPELDKPARRTPARAARPESQRQVTVRVSAEHGASITVDGRPLGSAPVGEIELPRGPHRFVVELPDGRVAERTIDVQGTGYDVRFK